MKRTLSGQGRRERRVHETDVIESLKQKEEELDNILSETREKALRIKKDALYKAEEIKLSMSKEADAALESYKKEEMEKIDKEVMEIKAGAIKKSEGLRLLDKKIFENAVDAVVHYLTEDINQ